MPYINDQESQVKRGNVLSRLGQVCIGRAADGSFCCSDVRRYNLISATITRVVGCIVGLVGGILITLFSCCNNT